jgi:hypothetical protein
MKRMLSAALLGASFLIPAEATAQRVRVVIDHPRAVPVTGRLAECRAPSRGRAYVCRPETNVVYRYAGGARRPVVRDWAVVEWGRIHMYPVRGSRQGLINEGRLRDMLGDRTVERVRDRGRRFGLRGPVRGDWHESLRFGAVLTLRVDGREVAELLDFDRDGIVDQVLLRDLRFS